MARSRELSKIFSSDTLVSLDNEIQNNIIIQAESEQTANLLELRNSSGSVVSSIGPTGALTGIGKILQVVRATDSTDRTTTSTSAVDANISVTITPQKSNSAIMVIWSVIARTTATSQSNFQAILRITDSSNNSLSGAFTPFAAGPSSGNVELVDRLTIIGWSTPATTSPVTYKGRFSEEGAGNNGISLNNSSSAGQLFAIEVAA
jgi:hypothetical protein